MPQRVLPSSGREGGRRQWSPGGRQAGARLHACVRGAKAKPGQGLCSMRLSGARCPSAQTQGQGCSWATPGQQREGNSPEARPRFHRHRSLRRNASGVKKPSTSHRPRRWWEWGFVARVSAPQGLGEGTTPPTRGGRVSSHPPDGLAKPTPHARTLSPCSPPRGPTWTVRCPGGQPHRTAGSQPRAPAPGACRLWPQTPD